MKTYDDLTTGLQAVLMLAAFLLWLHPSQIYALSRSYPATFLAIQLQPLNLGLTPTSAGLLLRLCLVALAVGMLVLGWQWPRASRIVQRPFFRWLVLITWVALLLFAAIPRLYSFKRQLVVLLPYLALLAAWGLRGLPRSLAVGLLTGGLALGIAITLLVLPLQRREPWDSVVAGLQGEMSGASAVWVDDLVWPGFDYYARRQKADVLIARAEPLLGGGPLKLPGLAPAVGADLWLVLYDDAYRDLRILLPPACLANYELITVQREGGLGVYRYIRRATPIEPAPAVAKPSQAALWGLRLLSPLSMCGSVTR